MDTNEVYSRAEQALDILCRAAKPKAGALLVLGCSTSEIMGRMIGTDSSEEAAAAVLDALLPQCKRRNLALAVQGCEHINRALCTDRDTMERFGLTEVCVKPWLHAGGACITEAARRIENAVMVEGLLHAATLGIDIGDTLIGMHLKPVVVPVHTTHRRIGEANLVLAYSRPPLIGGPRAQYPDTP